MPVLFVVSSVCQFRQTTVLTCGLAVTLQFRQFRQGNACGVVPKPLKRIVTSTCSFPIGVFCADARSSRFIVRHIIFWTVDVIGYMFLPSAHIVLNVVEE